MLCKQIKKLILQNMEEGGEFVKEKGAVWENIQSGLMYKVMK